MADNKADKMKARLPRGFVDRHSADIRAVDAMTNEIKKVYELYGFEPVEQPLIEYTDALGKFLPDQDRPNEGVFSFQDDDEQWLSLRYDLTAPLARFVAENFESIPKPYRSYRSGWVFRNEKPGPGRFRQFMQFDADIVGTPGVAADAEMAMMMADTLDQLGLEGQYVIRVNNRKLLDGIMAAAQIPEFKKLDTLRSLDKFDKFGEDGVKLLLTTGRKDESGDFTKGVGLTANQADLLLSIFAPERAYQVSYRKPDGSTGYMPGDVDSVISNWDAIVHAHNDMGLAQFSGPASANPSLRALLNANVALNSGESAGAAIGYEGIVELLHILALLQAAGYDDGRVKIDPSVVRGLEYYTGPVYEAELLFEVPNEKGEIVRFGSVAGGGRYDGLVSRFRGEPVPATGFSIGVSRLTAALKNLGKLDTSDVIAPVVVLVMDKDTEALGRYQQMVTQLRRAGIRAEMYLGGAGMKAQMKYADRRGAPCVVIQGGDERANGEVQIKDLVAGAKAAEAITDHAEWRDSRPAQFSVKESELVEAVQKVLDAQKAERDGA